MSNKPAPRCPGCGNEMELMELEHNAWRYSCDDCGWRSPAVHGPGKEGKDAAYDKAMKRWEPMHMHTTGKWISVDERMPEPGQRVIAAFGGCLWSVDIAQYLNDKFANWDGQRVECITHWMPLPVPPKEGE